MRSIRWGGTHEGRTAPRFWGGGLAHLVGRLSWVALLVVSLLSVAGPVRAADEERVLRARAADLATRGDCGQALALLDQAKGLDPSGDTAVLLLRGRCLVADERYEEAIPLLERAVAAQPDSGEAALALGIARYETGDRNGALTELERAEALMPDRPEPPLYLGLVLLEREENVRAAERFQRADRLDGEGAPPIAGYYEALALAGSGDAERAEAALRRVEERGAGTVWGERASALLAAEEDRRASLARNSWLMLQAGIDYDTNVALRSDQVTNPNDISSKGDFRGWWAVDGGTDLFVKDGWRLGLGGRYSGFEYFDASSFGQHFLTGRVWLDRALGERTSLRIAPEAGIGFFDNDEFLRFYGVRPELRHDFGKAGVGSLYGRYAYNDFRLRQNNLTGPGFTDRDGHDFRAGYDHTVGVSDTTVLRGGVFGRHYVAEGGEFDHSGVGGWLGVGQQLPFRFTLDASASYAHDWYQAESLFERQAFALASVDEREDHVVTASAQLSRPITNWLSAAARYQYLNNISNTNLFDYDRHLVGLYFNLDLLGLLR